MPNKTNNSLALNDVFSSLSAESLANLENYLKLLSKWSKVHNLVSSTSSNNLIDLIVDCKPLIDKALCIKGSIGDLGSGAGLPGLVLGIMQPERKIYLLESEASKCSFLQQVVIELNLTNISVLHQRIENWQPRQLPKLLCSRGLTSLDRLAKLCVNIVHSGTVILVLKARNPKNEIAKLNKLKCWDVKNCTPINSQPSRFLIEAVAI